MKTKIFFLLLNLTISTDNSQKEMVILKQHAQNTLQCIENTMHALEHNKIIVSVMNHFMCIPCSSIICTDNHPLIDNKHPPIDNKHPPIDNKGVNVDGPVDPMICSACLNKLLKNKSVFNSEDISFAMKYRKIVKYIKFTVFKYRYNQEFRNAMQKKIVPILESVINENTVLIFLFSLNLAHSDLLKFANNFNFILDYNNERSAESENDNENIAFKKLNNMIEIVVNSVSFSSSKYQNLEYVKHIKFLYTESIKSDFVNNDERMAVDAARYSHSAADNNEKIGKYLRKLNSYGKRKAYQISNVLYLMYTKILAILDMEPNLSSKNKTLAISIIEKSIQKVSDINNPLLMKFHLFLKTEQTEIKKIEWNLMKNSLIHPETGSFHKYLKLYLEDEYFTLHLLKKYTDLYYKVIRDTPVLEVGILNMGKIIDKILDNTAIHLDNITYITNLYYVTLSNGYLKDYKFRILNILKSLINDVEPCKAMESIQFSALIDKSIVGKYLFSGNKHKKNSSGIEIVEYISSNISEIDVKYSIINEFLKSNNGYTVENEKLDIMNDTDNTALYSEIMKKLHLNTTIHLCEYIAIIGMKICQIYKKFSKSPKTANIIIRNDIAAYISCFEAFDIFQHIYSSNPSDLSFRDAFAFSIHIYLCDVLGPHNDWFKAKRLIKPPEKEMFLSICRKNIDLLSYDKIPWFKEESNRIIRLFLSHVINIEFQFKYDVRACVCAIFSQYCVINKLLFVTYEFYFKKLKEYINLFLYSYVRVLCMHTNNINSSSTNNNANINKIITNDDVIDMIKEFNVKNIPKIEKCSNKSSVKQLFFEFIDLISSIPNFKDNLPENPPLNLLTPIALFIKRCLKRSLEMRIKMAYEYISNELYVKEILNMDLYIR